MGRANEIVMPLLDGVNKNWQLIAIQYINHTRKLEEVVKYSEKYHATKQPLLQWFEKIEARITTLSTVAVENEVIVKQLSEQKVSLSVFPKAQIHHQKVSSSIFLRLKYILCFATCVYYNR